MLHPKNFNIIANDKCIQLASKLSEKHHLIPSSLKHYRMEEIAVEVPKLPSAEKVLLMLGFYGDSNKNMTELMLYLDLLSPAYEVILFLPYLFYSRQEASKDGSASKVLMQILQFYNVKKLLTLDAHNLDLLKYNGLELTNYKIFSPFINSNEAVVVAPDEGSLRRLKPYNNFAQEVDFKKIRSTGGINQYPNFDPSAVDKKTCFIIDDIVDSANTLYNTAALLKEMGAKNINGLVTHNLMDKQASKLLDSSVLDKLITTNSIFSEIYSIKVETLNIDAIVVDWIFDLIKKGNI